MKVYALVGNSGTGKSYRAISIAKEYKIDIIIDDGLVIWYTKVVAGSSAKQEKTKIAAVKRALFTQEDHARDGKLAIKKYQPKAILILGTSLGMVKRIKDRLELPTISKIITIEEIARDWEIQKARDVRIKEGKHVIPVPALEVKKYFSGYFLDPLKIFQRNPKGKREEILKTVVRPTFSYMGRYTIADTVISSIVQFIASKVEGVAKVGRVIIASDSNGLFIELDVVMIYGAIIHKSLSALQKKITEELEYMTGQNVLGVNIYVKGLWMEQNED